MAAQQCPDCKMCQACSETRCRVCRGSKCLNKGRKLSMSEQIALFERLNSMASDTTTKQ